MGDDAKTREGGAARTKQEPVRLEKLGVSIEAPSTASLHHDEHRVTIALPKGTEVVVETVYAELPDWARSSGINNRFLRQGREDSGLHYRAYRSKVRVGVPGGGGLHRHSLEEQIEVESILPLTSNGFVRCRARLPAGYRGLSERAASEEGEAVDGVLAICRSLAPL